MCYWTTHTLPCVRMCLLPPGTDGTQKWQSCIGSNRCTQVEAATHTHTQRQCPHTVRILRDHTGGTTRPGRCAQAASTAQAQEPCCRQLHGLKRSLVNPRSPIQSGVMPGARGTYTQHTSTWQHWFDAAPSAEHIPFMCCMQHASRFIPGPACVHPEHPAALRQTSPSRAQQGSGLHPAATLCVCHATHKYRQPPSLA